MVAVLSDALYVLVSSACRVLGGPGTGPWTLQARSAVEFQPSFQDV